jgi:putative redox protein
MGTQSPSLVEQPAVPERSQEFWGTRPHPEVPGIRARVTLTQPESGLRQFVVETGSGHHFLVDDKLGATGPKPIELVAAALAGCTAFDVITILRGKKHLHVTSYEVRVEADQAEKAPQSFVNIRIHHMLVGPDLDEAAVSEAIRISEDKYCSVEAMLKPTATISTTFDMARQ